MSTPASNTTAPQQFGSALGRFLAANGALVALVLLSVGLFIATPNFLTTGNLLNVGTQAAAIAVLAFGMTFAIVAGGIDLSVGSVAALAAMVSAWTYTIADLPGFLSSYAGIISPLASIAAGAVLGLVSGLAIAFGRLPAFIATLAMMSVGRGLTLVLSDGRPISTSPAVSFLGSTQAGIPMPIVVLIVSGLIAAFILRYTVIGRSMYAVGGNVEAARLSGIPVRRVLVVVFTLSGMYAGIAAMVISGRLNSAQPQAGVTYELDAIAAVVIGGASLAGGIGKISGTLVGALILAVIRNGLNLMNVSSSWQQVAIGVVIAVAVGIDVLRRKNTRH